ncbi:Icarapin-like [Eufriesea mexicana]|uniref:Icarapin-like n=2 Tax=Eufriesea mexicana TaxID=516756 RepID=A0A310S9S4_9HYME|nr:Icarapin-like [Eufriesea mexicana]
MQRFPLENPLNLNFSKNDANWTSETKVINGNIVTTNETIYAGNNNYSTLVMRIRIIEVEPENDTNPVAENDGGFEVVTLPTVTESTSETNTATTNKKKNTSPTRSVETVEEFDNEISKDQNPLTA